ncbi:MAG: hypothetical protein VYC68_02055, partial [Candidatus Thermoplasmatota archaeon]|nr:hypothetical protein [Candidatus Thermoplasmatota archaeon]
MRLACKAMQWELADGRSEAIAIMVDMVPFAPLRVPKAWRLTGAVDDSCSAAPAVVIKLRVPVSWDDCRQGAAEAFIGLGNHLNGCVRDFIPRSGGPLAICADNSFGRGQRSGHVRAIPNCHHNGHPWRSLAI